VSKAFMKSSDRGRSKLVCRVAEANVAGPNRI
jgi:hypothetical protein